MTFSPFEIPRYEISKTYARPFWYIYGASKRNYI